MYLAAVRGEQLVLVLSFLRGEFREKSEIGCLGEQVTLSAFADLECHGDICCRILIAAERQLVFNCSCLEFLRIAGKIEHPFLRSSGKIIDHWVGRKPFLDAVDRRVVKKRSFDLRDLGIAVGKDGVQQAGF